MKNRKILLPALLSIALVFSLILSASVVGASAAVPLPDDRSINHSVIDSSRAASAMALNMPQGNVTFMFAAGFQHTVFLHSEGTVGAGGNNDWGQCDVSNWTDITQVATSGVHTVGLKSDGTVAAVGDNEQGQCDVGDWKDITQVAAGFTHTVGLKSDGTVADVGANVDGLCGVGGWTDIIQVAAGGDCTLGLKSDGGMVGVVWEVELAKWNLLLAVPPSDIENVTWVLESYRESGNLRVFPCSAINATFEGGRISGYAGCNWYGGDYELKGNNLSITELINTEVWCGEQINKLEQEYLTALRDAESYEIEGGKLRINCGNRLLVFNESYNSMEWWPWIIVAAAVVAVGLVIFFVRRRRAA